MLDYEIFERIALAFLKALMQKYILIYKKIIIRQASIIAQVLFTCRYELIQICIIIKVYILFM